MNSKKKPEINPETKNNNHFMGLVNVYVFPLVRDSLNTQSQAWNL